jgi:glutathionylspermidine synthase
VKTPWRAGRALSQAEYAQLRLRAIFDCGKWDPQVEDTAALSRFSLILRRTVWGELCEAAESLARETLAAEQALGRMPYLHRRLGLPRPIRLALRQPLERAAQAAAPRVMRFDFHFTRDGWRISEVNSDVPGGFIEASAVTRLMAEHESDAVPAGDPASAYADAIAQAATTHRTVAMIHATAFVDDRQVMIYLARLAAERGVLAHLGSPADVMWQDGCALLAGSAHPAPVDVLVRFFPAEWLPNLGRRRNWAPFFAGARTLLSNPGTALLTQSKRFPLVWSQLKMELPTWRRLLPETCDPREVNWLADDDWVLKPALGRVGEAIGLRDVISPKEWRLIGRDALWWPGHWAAQRRFAAMPLLQAGEAFFPVIGVYVVDGAACGAYGRIARRPLIDHRAQDIAVLVEGAPKYDVKGNVCRTKTSF